MRRTVEKEERKEKRLGCRRGVGDGWVSDDASLPVVVEVERGGDVRLSLTHAQVGSPSLSVCLSAHS